ncbi:peptidylprolyl isomerase [Terrabacter sp. 2YAF2]|uniref:peptidylprolyl isomerase n=1 Tax=Terrabacter sp. 2YAF2 TaxID=3233026 RepID=UPI003F9BBF0A
MADAQPARRRTVRLLVGTALLCLAVGASVIVLTHQQRQAGPTQAPTVAVTCVSPPTPRATFPRFTTAPPASVAAGSDWRAALHTTCGDVTLRLDGQRAPRSVASFIALARAGYWTDSVCHRLTTPPAPTAFLQCGDPSGRSTAEPGYDLPLENVPADQTYRVGDVGMARGDGFLGTAGEFFVVHHDFTVAPGSPVYSLIGHVDSGLDVVQHIVSGGGEDFRSDGPPFLSVSVLSVDVHRL